jgi:phage terminase large subunit-like protein
MRLGIKNQDDALILELTNSGYDKTSVCWRHHELSLKILEGTIVDEEWFAYVCQLDPCEACRAKGATQPNDGCKACDDWTDERVWPKVTPALGEVTTLEYLRGCVKQALNQPDMLARVKRLNFCCWTQGHSIWIPADQWEACRVDPLPTARNVPCAAAFDLSMKTDLSGCVVAQRFDDPAEGPPSTVEIEENEDGQKVRKVWSVKYRIALTPYAWLPEETLLERVKNERIPFDVWERAGHLRMTPGPVIDHHLIYDQFIGEIAPRFNPQRVGYDPYNATELAVDLRDRGKQTVVEIGQGRKLSEFIKLFYALVRLRRILHDGNPVFGWCIANAEPKHDRYENIWLEKSSANKRIDLAMAAIMATKEVVVLPAPRSSKRGGGARVWTPDGFRSNLPPGNVETPQPGAPA